MCRWAYAAFNTAAIIDRKQQQEKERRQKRQQKKKPAPSFASAFLQRNRCESWAFQLWAPYSSSYRCCFLDVSFNLSSSPPPHGAGVVKRRNPTPTFFCAVFVPPLSRSHKQWAMFVFFFCHFPRRKCRVYRHSTKLFLGKAIRCLAALSSLSVLLLPAFLFIGAV
jgi:hypothetical protein